MDSHLPLKMRNWGRAYFAQILFFSIYKFTFKNQVEFAQNKPVPNCALVGGKNEINFVECKWTKSSYYKRI